MVLAERSASRCGPIGCCWSWSTGLTTLCRRSMSCTKSGMEQKRSDVLHFNRASPNEQTRSTLTDSFPCYVFQMKHLSGEEYTLRLKCIGQKESQLHSSNKTTSAVFSQTLAFPHQVLKWPLVRRSCFFFQERSECTLQTVVCFVNGRVQLLKNVFFI